MNYTDFGNAWMATMQAEEKVISSPGKGGNPRLSFQQGRGRAKTRVCLSVPAPCTPQSLFGSPPFSLSLLLPAQHLFSPGSRHVLLPAQIISALQTGGQNDSFPVELSIFVVQRAPEEENKEMGSSSIREIIPV